MENDREKIFAMHKRAKGKLDSVPVEKITKETFPQLISPGAEIVSEYLRDKKESTVYTGKQQRVFIVSNGQHIHGLGNVGPDAVLPILESKALLLRQFGGVQAIPLPVQCTGSNDIVHFLQSIVSACGAILLDGLAEPTCSEVMEIVTEACKVPVIESNRHGISVALLAGLINAHIVVKKNLHHSRIAILGTGPIAVSLVRLLREYTVGDIVVVDRDGILHPLRTNIEGEKEWLAQVTNREHRTGGALEAVTGSDVVVSISKSGPLKEEYIRMMAQHAIVFALREPEPEITPAVAKEAGAHVIATKSASFPNYLTDALVLPHLLKVILEQEVQHIPEGVCVSLAKALAETVTTPKSTKILPTIFDRRITKQITNLF